LKVEIMPKQFIKLLSL